MVSLVLGSIISMLTSKGLGALSSAVEGGADKALEFVSEKTGIDLTDKTELSDEDVAELSQLESDHKIELEELALANKKEDNRHDEVRYTAAHDSYDKHSGATDKLSHQIMRDNLIIIAVLVVVDCVVIYFMKDNAGLVATISGLIGAIVNSLLSERQSVVNFRFGSSIGSKIKSMVSKDK